MVDFSGVHQLLVPLALKSLVITVFLLLLPQLQGADMHTPIKTQLLTWKSTFFMYIVYINAIIPM